MAELNVAAASGVMLSLLSISQGADVHFGLRHHHARKKKGDQAGRPVVVLSLILRSLPDDLEVGAAAMIDPNAATIEAPAITLPAG
jgi:hypothetical protein